MWITLQQKNLNAAAAGLGGQGVIIIIMDASNFFSDIAMKFADGGADTVPQGGPILPPSTRSEALYTHLESAEGGLLKVIRSKEHPHLAIIRYVKGSSDMTHANTHYFRSVVWNTETNKPVAFSPFQSVPLDSSTFVSKESLVVEDFWDGTMINLFYDDKTAQWLIATRSNIGGNCRFYGPQTFYRLFWDTFAGLNITVGMLNEQMCYSWVLQHPTNRIVVPVPVANLRLVQVVKMTPLDFLPPLSEYPAMMNMAGRRLPLSGLEVTVKALEAMIAANDSVYCQGFVVKDTATGQRWKIRTPTYKMLHELRGNTPRLDYKWLELRQKGSMNAYMHHFPEDRQPFDALWLRLKTQTRVLYQTYCDVFKARSLPSRDAPKHLRRLLYDMQDHYLNRLRPAQLTLTWSECVSWVNAQDIPRQLFLANYLWLQQNKAAGPAIAYEPTDENLVTPIPVDAVAVDLSGAAVAVAVAAAESEVPSAIGSEVVAV